VAAAGFDRSYPTLQEAVVRSASFTDFRFPRAVEAGTFVPGNDWFVGCAGVSESAPDE
jgi:hypothetical protein